jgi:N-acetylglucosaminyl-diphospho-decaprenol L-rhamnosyltransferase
LNIEDFTFVIVSYRSEDLIFNCLNHLPIESSKIVIENSGNTDLKYKLEKKYKNINCHVMKENLGYGKGNNYGIKKAKTEYIFIINPDVILNLKKIYQIIDILKKEKFTIAGFLEKRDGFDFKKKKVLEKDFVKGFAMILNKKKIQNFFDENIFLYLEEIDLCKRVKNKKGRIILLNTKITHLGGASHGKKFDLEIEKSRHWHWMWSKFYFNRKHRNYLYALIITLPNFISSLIKLALFKILKKEKKYEKYKMRFNGLLNAYLKKKSFYRPYDKN